MNRLVLDHHMLNITKNNIASQAIARQLTSSQTTQTTLQLITMLHMCSE